MNVNGSSSIYSLWLKNIQCQKTSSDSNETVSSSFSMGSDLVTISQAALNALLGSDGEMQNDDFASNGGTWSQPMEDALNELNASGILSDEELETVKSALSTAIQAPPPLPSANTASSTKNTNPFQTVLDQLVVNGDITEEQGDSIASALNAAIQAPPPRGGGQELTGQLDDLVSAGTISEDQESAILEALRHGYQADADEEDKSPFEDILNQLVFDATITEEQKDSILEAFGSISPGSVTL